ncbi:LuxR C-terminal-related transcriptional regulator [Arthrobacter sp. Sr24]
MTTYYNVAAGKWTKPAALGTFEAMGAADRKFWSSFVRQAEIDRTVLALNNHGTYGVAVVGPWGVGKTTLGRAVEKTLAPTTHIERIFGSSAETLIPYGPLSLLMARLPATALETPTGVIRGIDELIRTDAAGRDVLLIVDDLPGMDFLTVGVVMHLLLGGTAKVLVMARDTADLPEDLAWLAKDGQLGEIRLDYFSLAEVGELIAKATGTFVSQTAVTALHEASNGIPLVLQALFREQVAKGSIVKHLGGWVVKDTINVDSTSALAEILSSRLSREDAAVRLGVEKMSLLGNAPLQVAISALGQETLWQLEERGFVEISTEGRHRAFLAEQYVGDIVRSGLSQDRMAELFAEMALTLDQELESLDSRETMSLAAWTLDAGMVLDPRFALAAALNALRGFDPVLALRCAEQVPINHRLWVKSVQARSAAYQLLAEYGGAVAVLDAVPAARISELSIEDFGAWVLACTGALLWVPDGARRTQDLLTAAQAHLVAEGRSALAADERQGRTLLNLARFEYLVHQGEFAAVIPELEAAESEADADYRLNCACLLVPALAVVGRELDAIALAQRIETDTVALGVTPLFSDYYRNGKVIAQIWSGQWMDCVAMLQDEIEGIRHPIPYRGGLIELNLGLAHAFAGRGAEAVQVLMSAAAQLEARNSDNALGLAYAALAFCHAQVNNEQDARSWLALAQSVPWPTLWTNQAMQDFFILLALRWLDDPRATEQMHISVLVDIDKGRFAMASMSLFAATIQASDKEYALLEEVSLRRQGPMATFLVMVARSCRTRDAETALEAAHIAQTLKLDAVESRCAVLALNFARDAGKNSLARLASQRLERLHKNVPKMPFQPQNAGVKLTQREIQVAKLAKRGLGNLAIADKIGVSVRTVEGHLYQLYSKLGITTRQELAEDEEF